MLNFKSTFKGLSSYMKTYPKSPNFLKFQKLSSSVYVNHRDTLDNNDDTPFDFTSENYKKIEEVLVPFTQINHIYIYRQNTHLIKNARRQCHFSGLLKSKMETFFL